MSSTPAGGRLIICATPIGNLGDVTLRVLEALKAADVVAAEDTRVTRKLFGRYEITTPLERCDEHTVERQAPQLVARMLGGQVIAFVSDAGTPGVSDPGARLIAAAAELTRRLAGGDFRFPTVKPEDGFSYVQQLRAVLAAGTQTPGGAVTPFVFRRASGGSVAARAAGLELAVNPEARLRQVCTATAANRSSMLQDILAGRSTEIEALNGQVAARGRALGVATPVNDLLTRLLRAVGQAGPWRV